MLKNNLGSMSKLAQRFFLCSFSGYSEWSDFEVNVLCGIGTEVRTRECYHINHTLHDTPQSREVCKQFLGDWKEERQHDTGKPCSGENAITHLLMI